MKIKQHIAFIILFLILFTYLGVKTLPENGWSGWYNGIGDAQSLLSIKYWVEDGFIKSKFLAIPIGYSKIVQYLDQPEMRQHARGTTTGKLIGNRLYYTHYPPGYLFPYALLMKLGFNQRYWFRLLALIFSFSALILLYVFFNLISKNSLVSFFAVAYYALSTMFLDYADSLANQPIDDLLRAAILVVSMLAIRYPHHTSPLLRGRIKEGVIWFLYLILSLSSYDSTFFVFVWLVGLDIVTMWSPAFSGTEPPTKKLLTIFSVGGRKWLFFASAPILAFVLQIMQNWWYLGWGDMWMDFFGAFMAKAQTGNVFKHIEDVFYTFSLMTGLKTIFAAIVSFSLFLCLWLLKDKFIFLKNNLYLILVLFLSGAVYPFIFVGSGGFSYQGKQMTQFIVLLIGLGMMFLVQAWNLGREKIIALLAKDRYFSGILCILIIILGFLWFGQISRTIEYVNNWPNNKVDSVIIKLSEQLHSEVGDRDAVLFYLGDNLSFNSVTEYYFGMPILYFKNQQDLMRDLVWLRQQSIYSFVSVIMADQVSIIDNIKKQILELKLASENVVSKTSALQGEYSFNITSGD